MPFGRLHVVERMRLARNHQPWHGEDNTNRIAHLEILSLRFRSGAASSEVNAHATRCRPWLEAKP